MVRTTEELCYEDHRNCYAFFDKLIIIVTINKQLKIPEKEIESIEVQNDNEIGPIFSDLTLVN